MAISEELQSIIIHYLEMTIAPEEMEILKNWLGESENNDNFLDEMLVVWALSRSSGNSENFSPAHFFAKFAQL